jgi:hypothetical protein
MHPIKVLAAAIVVAGTTPAVAEDVPTTIIAGGDASIIYVFPTSPQSFIPVAGLPSFLVMPGAEVPAIATQVVYTVPRPAPLVRASATTTTAVSVAAMFDCSNFVGVVTIAGPDRFHLDKDGDSIGCEPEDR